MFDYDAKKSRLVEVARALEDPAVWNDSKKAQDLGRERSTLESAVGTIEKIDANLKDSAELFGLARAEGDEDTLQAVSGDVDEARRLVEHLEFSRMFNDPMDPNSCFIDLNAGQGGTEAQDWVSMLLRMYLK
ncbi:MAG: PCRF domain-containing protein, partial [Usitatibacter sp.]